MKQLITPANKIKLLLPFVIFFIVSSCNKEKSAERRTPEIIPAVLTFGGAGGDCSKAVVAGSYAKGKSLAATNTVTIQVNVTSPGLYNITTDTVNGYSFSASAYLSSTGVKDIVLTGKGTPIDEGVDDFTVKTSNNNNGCDFSIQVGNVVLTPAVYTMNSASGVCSGAAVAGTYAQGVILAASNTATVQVNVTSTGTYTLATNTVSGITFAATGLFTTTGVQNVVLTGSGTPTATGALVFTPAIGTSQCTFTVNVAGAATYTMAGVPGNCTGGSVAGAYSINSPLTATNTATVQVNVTAIGSYSLSTNTVSGISFSKSGVFTSTGLQTVVLNGSGTPTASGALVLKPKVGTSECSFTVNVSGPAMFTYSGGTGNCTGTSVNGTYTAASVLNSNNTVTIQVNVTSIGSYNISTNTANGFKFSKSGTFTTTGLQDVILVGSGTPAVAGTTNLTFNNGCSFAVTVQAAPVVTGTYQCKIDGVLTTFIDRAKAKTLDNFFDPPTPYLFIDGYTDPPNGSYVPQFTIAIIKNDNSQITPGTYNEKNLIVMNGYKIEAGYYKVNAGPSVTIWNTSSNLLSTNPPFTITITSVNNGRVKGTFNGKLTNSFEGSTKQITITEGSFDLPIKNG
jgi:hypothetical protein